MKINILTAASEAFEESLICMIASLNINWPNHPEILVYDLGMSERTINFLKDNRIEVIKVPPFKAHWRKHFTWKLWAIHQCNADIVLWLDAGLVVLGSLVAVIKQINNCGYFITPTYHPLIEAVSDNCRKSCGVTLNFLDNKMCFSGNTIGFKKHGVTKILVDEAYTIALVEENIAANEPMHRHDQAILSTLIYKYFNNPIVLDGFMFSEYRSPHQTADQRIWAHRRKIHHEDKEYLVNHFSGDNKPYIPRKSEKSYRKKISVGTLVRGLKNRIRKSRTRIYNGVRD